jgi:hypothetical protein
MICQQSLNLGIISELATLIHGAVAKLSCCGCILGKPAVKPSEGWRFSVSGETLEVIGEVVSDDEVSCLAIPTT